MNTSKPLTQEMEKHLIESSLAGDADQFCLLVKGHHKRIYYFILNYLSDISVAEDLTQETFIDAYHSLSRFRGEVRFASWLMGIAINKVRNYINRAPEKRHEMLCIDYLALETDDADPLQQLQQREMMTAMIRSFRLLSEDLQEPFLLVCFEGLSYTEAAGILGIAEGTVKSRIFRARKSLMKMLDGL